MVIIREPGKIIDDNYIIDAKSFGIEKQNAVYFIKDHNNVLIDTGTSTDAKRIHRYIIEELQCPEINMIIITHHHLDHSGGVFYFLKKYQGIEIIISEKATDLETELLDKAKRGQLQIKVKKVKDGDRLQIGTDHELLILEVPGHSPDHIAVYDLKTKFVFVGDSIGAHHIGERFCRPTAYKPDFQFMNYLKTLKRYLAMDIKGIGIASYGFVKGNEAKETIKLGLSIFNQWYDTIKHLHNQGHSLDQICDEIIKIFGKSPGEIRENRPDTWIKGFLKSSIQGFIDSGMEDAKKK